MTPTLNVTKAGFVFACVIGGWHLCWSALVAAGLGQKAIDFILWMHFIKPIYMIEPFDAWRAAILLIVTTVAGFLVGSIFALLWNAGRRA
jgi:hypothetical protein